MKCAKNIVCREYDDSACRDPLLDCYEPIIVVENSLKENEDFKTLQKAFDDAENVE